MKPKIYVDGEHGTTGLQILERLNGRQDVEVLSIPHAERHSVDARCALLNAADIAILCLPDAAAKEAAAMVEGGTTRLIDASTAHRTDPNWTFGFKELNPDHAQTLAKATRVSNPGCYPTGAIALLRPLRLAGLLAADAFVTVNAVSGYTGGGKGLIAQMEQADHPDAITTTQYLYGTGLSHKHVPEISRYGMLERKPIFAPSVARYPQGMVVQIPFHLDALAASNRSDVHAALADHYAACPGDHVIVRSLEEADAVTRLEANGFAGRDDMELFVFGNEEQINLVARLDNLGKGASGACVQTLDLMVGAEA
ncbi:MAG: N-acetyl-gamma-glutamyl-phosphate reductase [Pseudomonadota bacterium]